MEDQELTPDWTETRRREVLGMVQLFGAPCHSFCLMYDVEEMRKVAGRIEARSRFIRGDKTYRLSGLLTDSAKQHVWGEMKLALTTAEAALESLNGIARYLDAGTSSAAQCAEPCPGDGDYEDELARLWPEAY